MTRLRSEAQSPFRTVRIVAFACISANGEPPLGSPLETAAWAWWRSLDFWLALIRWPPLLSRRPSSPPVLLSPMAALLGTLITIPQLASTRMATSDTLTNLAIDLGVAALFAWLLRRDLDAQDLQLRRISREERLGALRVELANRRSRTLSDLRSTCRVVVAAGNAAQLASALDSAQAYKEELLARAVTLVLVPLDPKDTEAGAVASSPVPLEDLRWRVTPLRGADWADWLGEQMLMAGKADKGKEGGVYLSLRMDGRVRASGLGQPPWARLVAELPPNAGGWKALDGMDGSIDALR